jgi:uncharacterized protein
MESAKRWKASFYNCAIPLGDERGILYNTRTGAILELSPNLFQKAATLTDRGCVEAVPEAFHDDALFPHLAGGGFLVDSSFDELSSIEEKYQAERRRSQFLLTILPTFACNLGCDYCFVGKKHGMMSVAVQDALVGFVASRLRETVAPSMNVDWFGGEPLLALPIIERLSSEFISLCDEAQLPYRAQVITNGTRLNRDSVEVLKAARVDRLQISIDGPPEIHDARRPYKAGGRSSYSTIMEALPCAVGQFTIRLRVNVDNRNLHAVWDLLESFVDAGWIGPDTGFFPYLARVSPFTEACSSVATSTCSMEDFYRVQFRWMERLEELGVSVGDQGLYQFPEPKLYNCGAVGSNGFVFTPEGEIHKCGLTVDDSHEAIGHLERPGLSTQQLGKWNDFSPLKNEICRSCEYLPSCLGGCPRNQMEMRTVQMKENCTYHKTFESKILKFHLGHRADIDMAVPGPLEVTKPLFTILS